MKRKLCILVILLLFCFINVKADDTCTKEELARLRELADKVEIYYEYEFKEVKQNGVVSKYPVFSLTATNLNSDLKVMIVENYLEQKYKEFKDGNKTSATIKNFNEGEKVNVTIKAFVPNICSGKTVGSKTIKIPYYNRYSETELCQNNPNYKNCSELTSDIISYEKFANEFNDYINENISNDNIDNKTESDNWDILITTGIIVFVMSALLLVVVIIKKRKRSAI